MKHVRIILNGKGAANPQVRAAVERIREQGQTCEVEVPSRVPLNLDGEPHCWDHIRFEVAPRCLLLVLPEDCPLIAGGAKAR